MAGGCLEPETLLALARDRREAAAQRHVEGCDRCRAEVGRLRILLQAAPGAPTGAPEGACLDEQTVAAIADGALRGDRLREALGHLEHCGRCRRGLRALVELLDEPDVRAEVARVDRRLVRRWPLAAGTLGLAAAAALAIALVPREPPAPALHRDSATTDRAAAVAPVGEVGAVTGFTWLAVPDADRYQLVLFGDDGTVLWEAATEETYVVPPDSVRLVPGRSYFWQVRARVGYDQWAESALHDFRLRAP